MVQNTHMQVLKPEFTSCHGNANCNKLTFLGNKHNPLLFIFLYTRVHQWWYETTLKGTAILYRIIFCNLHPNEFTQTKSHPSFTIFCFQCLIKKLLIKI